MNDDFWDEEVLTIANKIMKKPDEIISELCPVCGNQLIIGVGRYQRFETKMLGVTIECKTCDQAVAIDGIEEKR